MHIVSIANGDHNDIENKTPYHETDIHYGTIFALKKKISSYDNTPETQYSKPRYSKILYIVNKTQLPSWDFIEILCLDIVNDSITKGV